MTDEAADQLQSQNEVESNVVDLESEELSAEEVAEARALRRRKARKATSRWLSEWLAIVLLAAGAAYLIRTFVFQTFFIPSSSMVPTLQIGDRIIVSKLSTDFGAIHRGDILVFKRPPAENCGGAVVNDLVKRVIGLPGDHLYSLGDTIYVNGQPLKESWTHVEPLGNPLGNVVVPKNSYFMMGDNHPESCDSRMWGTLPRRYVVGRVVFRIWPLSRFGTL